MPKHTMRGLPDITVIKDGRYIGVEVKAARGTLSTHQIEFGRQLVKNGGEYIVAKSIDDVIKAGL